MFMVLHCFTASSCRRRHHDTTSLLGQEVLETAKRTVWLYLGCDVVWHVSCKQMGVSKNSGFSPQIIHFNRVFHYKPSILGYPYFWKHLHLHLWQLPMPCTPNNSFGLILCSCVARKERFVWQQLLLASLLDLKLPWTSSNKNYHPKSERKTQVSNKHSQPRKHRRISGFSDLFCKPFRPVGSNGFRQLLLHPLRRSTRRAGKQWSGPSLRIFWTEKIRKSFKDWKQHETAKFHEILI